MGQDSEITLKMAEYEQICRKVVNDNGLITGLSQWRGCEVIIFLDKNKPVRETKQKESDEQPKQETTKEEKQ